MKTDFENTGKLYPKIDIYYKQTGRWVYACSTQQWRLCRDARQSWCNVNTKGQTRGVIALFCKES